MKKLDIVKLIEKNSITRLSKDYENRLLTKIKGTFTDNQQQLFVASFYCYLNYNKSKDFVIDFDNVWKWLGYTRKSDCKRVLEKFFVINIDYKIEKAAAETSVAAFENDKEVNLGGSGLNKENITITINTFKKICMKACTKKADEIHDYYIKLEELFQETLNEQTNELYLQLENKDKKIEDIKEELKNKEEENKELEGFIKKRKHQRHKASSCVYIIMNQDIKDRFKFGETDNINTRLREFHTYAPTPYRIHKIWYTRLSKKTEKLVHDLFEQYRVSLSCEWFKVEILDKVIEFMDHILDLYDNYDTVTVIEENAKLVFIDTNEKHCNKCKLRQPLTNFYIRHDCTIEEPTEFVSDEERQEFYSKKYRSQCKKCLSEQQKEHVKMVRTDPNIGKKECYKIINNIKEYCKQCSKCKNILLSKDFHSDLNKNDGLHTVCKECRKETKKEVVYDKITCEFCGKEVIGSHNLKNHHKTLSCLEAQGETVIRKHNTGRSKKIQQLNKDTLIVIKEFACIEEAAKEINISRTGISKVLRGINKTAGNFSWKYI